MIKFAIAVELSAMLFLFGCGSSPTAPSDSPISSASFDGAWTLDWRMDACQGERHCVLRLGSQNSTVVRLIQLGEQVQGVLEVGHGVPVIGNISPGGELVLHGQAPAAGSMDAIGAVDAVVTVRSDPQRGLIGSLRYDSRPTYNPDVSGTYVRGGEILRATRRALPQSALSGTWRGRYVVRGCLPVGWPTCAPYQPDSIGLYEMVLSQNAPDINGSFTLFSSRDFLALQGVLEEGTLILMGLPNRRVVSGGTVELRLLKWLGAPDMFGRMTGSFTFVDEYQRTAGSVLSYTVDADLLGVTRLP